MREVDLFATIVQEQMDDGMKYSGFLRSLNRWGFKSIGGASNPNTWYHERFNQFKPHLAHSILLYNADTATSTGESSETTSYAYRAAVARAAINDGGGKTYRKTDGYFPVELMSHLSDPSNERAIAWTPDGLAFR